MFESQYTVIFQDSYRCLLFIYCCSSKWIYPFSTHDLVFMFFSFNPKSLWFLFKLYASSIFSARWQYTTDIKIYTSATLSNQGPLTFTFGPSQDLPDSSVGKDSACKAVDISSIPGQGSSAGEGISYPLQHSLASLVAQLVKNPPEMWETWV